MMFSTKAEYGVRVMAHLAKADGERPISLGVIADAEGLPLAYLEHLVQRLRRAELRPLWKGFAIRPQSVTAEHQARFTLVDSRGFQRVGYPGAEATPERLAHDLRMLEREAG